jgi:DNA polymerase elongation subunit (family B)
MREMRAWILDVYPDYARDEMVIWLKTVKGKAVRFTDAYTPSFYVSPWRQGLNNIIEELACSPMVKGITYDREKRLADGRQPGNLLRVDVARYAGLLKLAEKINALGEFSRYRLYNVDISLPLRYLFEKVVSPMLLLRVERKLDSLCFEAFETPETLSYRVPELRMAEVSLRVKKEGSVAKLSDTLESITMLVEDESIVFDGGEVDALVDFAEALEEHDPDVICTQSGDSFLMPYLYHRARVNELDGEFQLGREPSGFEVKEGKSYYSYGRVVYKPPSYHLNGRVHIDMTRFLYRESGMHGLLDLSRFAGIPMQMLARMTPGNTITTMQLRYAYEKGILVPWKTQNPEYFKTAWKLLYSDRGGYIFDPQVGIYEDVTELDFSSMYPNIMVKFNISPETVLCRCCKNSKERVPVLGYHICEKRTGLVPNVLSPVIERRLTYKRMMREASCEEERRIYGERQAILKWLLITSFGYQGYRNSRFGRIESHEAICAYGRELLLRAKEVAEQRGYEVLHGFVDSLWVKGKASDEELERLCKEITSEVGIDVNLEGKYRWIVFLPNKSNGAGALNRYYGVLGNGELKVRGVEMRMSNTPGIIADYQRDVLSVLAQAKGIREFYEALPMVFEILRMYISMIWNGEISPEKLVFTVAVSKELPKYRVNNFSYAALKQLKQEGVEILPGQPIRYIVTNNKSKEYNEKVRIAEAWQEKDSYDTDFYIKHLLKATESLLLPYGYTTEKLKNVLKGEEQSSLHSFINKGDG